MKYLDQRMDIGDTHENDVVNLYSNRVESELNQLEQVISTFLSRHNNLSVNGLSKKCGVSESTLRRINSRKAKRLPSLTIVLNILSYISKKTNVEEISNFFGGPLKAFLKEHLNTHESTEFLDVKVDLSSKLNDPVKYLIYKVAANHNGITKEQILELYGLRGLSFAKKLLDDQLLEFSKGTYTAIYKNYMICGDSFKDNFKATADLIKPEKLGSAPAKYSQVFYNMSESVNIEAYATILKIQRDAIKRVRRVLKSHQSQGDIDVFCIGAVDSLSLDSAYETHTKLKT